uniref:Uncharacterized protein n=1 Tax=Anopheles minimus TaxID=112268 RepID=A0A182W240_9DIPT
MASFVGRIYRKLNDLERKFANDPDQFVILRHLTFLFAIQYDTSTGVLQRALWYCYRSVLMFVFGSYCYKAYWHMTHSAYSFSMFNILGTLWIFAGALARSIIFDRSMLARLEWFLNDRSFRGVGQRVHTARNTVQRQNNRYLVVTALVLFLETLIFLGTNLMVQPEFMLVYNGRVVGDLVIQLLYGFTTCYWGSLYVIIFFMIFVMLNVFRGEMSILVQSFHHINQVLDQFRPSLDASDASIAQEREMWNKLRNLLKLNVQRHIELLENLAAFRTILGPFSFIQYYGSFVLIAYYCFIITYNGLTSLTVIYIGFIVFLVVESFLFCRIISSINDLHAKIGMVLYEMKWYNKLRFSTQFPSEYRHVRSTLLIIIIRTQTPLSFTINRIGIVSMNRFAELLNSSYSFLALLIQLKNAVFPKFQEIEEN